MGLRKEGGRIEREHAVGLDIYLSPNVLFFLSHSIPFLGFVGSNKTWTSKLLLLLLLCCPS